MGNVLSHAVDFCFILLAAFLFFKTFFNLYVSWRGKRENNLHAIEVIRPLIFIKFFATCLTIPFFSQYILNITLASGMSGTAASFVYVIYQVAFIFMLIPSGYIVETKNLKFLLLVTFFVEAMAFLFLGVSTHFWEIFIIQLLFGFIVTISSSAEYAYIFAQSTAQQRNNAVALYSNTIKGAMISGVFIGGVLSAYVGMRNVFFIASGAIFICLFYIIAFLPNVSCHKTECKKFDVIGAIRDLPLIFKDIGFLKVIILIGFPLGFLSEGVILFSLPILLTHNHISHVSIGEIMVLFSLGFFLTNKFTAKKADRLQNEGRFMFLGLIGVVCGLLLMACFNSLNISGYYLGIYALIGGLFLLGIFRGFLVTPAISYISKSQVTDIVGKNVSVSVYRLLNVLGKIVGPLVIMQLLLIFHYSSVIFLVLAGLFLIISLLFKLRKYSFN